MTVSEMEKAHPKCICKLFISMAISRKFGRSESGFVKANLAFGLIYEAKSQVDQYETRPDNLFDVIFYIYKLLKRPDGF